MAYWVIPNKVIARIEVRAARPVDVRAEYKPSTRYVPDKLPPMEIPQIRFKLSGQSARRRLESNASQFRFMPRIEWERNLSQ